MRIRSVLAAGLSLMLGACASHMGSRFPASTPAVADRDRVFVDVNFFRVTPEATARLLGSDLGTEGRTLVFDIARSNTFFRDARVPSPGIEVIDRAVFLATDGRRTVSGAGQTYHLDANGLMELHADEAVENPKSQAFHVGVRPDILGDRLTIYVSSVWSDATWVGKSPRPDFLQLSATSTLPLSGSTVLLISAVLAVGAEHERYVLSVSAHVLRASQVASAGSKPARTQ